MRERVEIAKRLLATRATVRELERRGADRSGAHPLDAAWLQVCRASAQVLAWALDIDLNQIDLPASLLSLEEQPTTVQLHRLELGEAPAERLVMWLVEIPAHHDAQGPDYSTESWSCFLHDEQARALLAALSACLPTALPSPAADPAPMRLPLLRSASSASSVSSASSGGRRLAVITPPPEPDVEGGYGDYAGLARIDPAAFDDKDEEGDEEGDEGEPPMAGARSPRGA